MSQLVLLEITPPIAVLTLNRPGRHNSLIPPLLTTLLDCLEQIRQTPEIRAVVLQANGRSFSTGGDVRGFYEHLDSGLEEYAQEIVGALNQCILALLDLPVPVVAGVHGMVTGGSLGLVLASDIVLVGPMASFTPYYNVVGFSPDGGWTALLPQLIGARRTTDILLRNQTISAEQAVIWGLATELVPTEDIQAKARSVATDIAGMKPGSNLHIKQLTRQRLGDISIHLESEREHFVQQITTPEARQGIRAFLGRSVSRQTGTNPR